MCLSKQFTCMYVCARICICACVSEYVYALCTQYVCVYVYAGVHAYMWVYIYMHIHICVYIIIFANTYISMCSYLYLRMNCMGVSCLFIAFTHPMFSYFSYFPLCAYIAFWKNINWNTVLLQTCVCIKSVRRNKSFPMSHQPPDHLCSL